MCQIAMTKFGVQMVNKYSLEVLDNEDKEFDNLEDAERYCLECNLNFSEGADVLDDAGRSSEDPDDVDFVVTTLL